jgi:xylose isomerase
MDTLARSLLVAADMLEMGTLESHRERRYAGWESGLGAQILSGSASLGDLADRVASGEIDPRPVSGRQELLEGLVNERIWAADRNSKS